MKFTFNVRKKTIKDYPVMERLEEMFGEAEPIVFPPEYGIVTASNSSHFPGLQLMLYSLRKRHSVPVLIYNVGMTKKQLQWLESVPDIEVSPQFDPPFGKMDYWQAWVKPFYMRDSKFQKAMWIDCDTAITGNLMDIIAVSNNEPFFTADHSGTKEGTYNDPALYILMPIEGIEKDSGEFLNTGVFVLDKDRDAKLVDEWCKFVQKAGENQQVARLTTCWDQGACKWVLQKLNLMHTINNKIEFNHPARSRQCPFPSTPRAMEVFLGTINDSIDHDVVVMHFMGSPKPWKNWSEMLPVQIAQPKPLAIMGLGGRQIEEQTTEPREEIARTVEAPGCLPEAD